MYTHYFQLRQAPFSIAPDPRYLYMSQRHREALSHLLYAVTSSGGVALLTGEIGTGKTTVTRCFLEQIPANCNVAYIFNPKLTVEELLQSVCEEFGIGLQPGRLGGIKGYIDALNRFLLAAHAEGRNSVLVIDEAQNLSPDVLEQLRLLTNLETSERKLLQIILIGQPELRTMLARPELEQLSQRVIARYHLEALSEQDTASYIQHRLTTAGLTSASPFQAAQMKRIHQLTRGVPRRINLLCDRAMLGAFATGEREAGRDMIDRAAAELFDRRRPQSLGARKRWQYAALGIVVGTLAAGAAVSASSGSMKKMIGEGVAASAAFSERAAKAVQAAGTQRLAMLRPPQPAAEAPAASVTPAASNATRTAASAPAPAPSDAREPAGPAAADTRTGASPALSLADIDSGTAGILRERDEALRRLAVHWNPSLQNAQPCDPAPADGLHCYASSAGFAELRLLDRPAVLSLRDRNQKTYYALLTGLSDTGATLLIGDVRQEVSLVALARHFPGEFATFWRAPPAFRSLVQPGDKGEEVAWIAAQLARLHGTKPGTAPAVYDQKMRSQIRDFQSAHGLHVDGIVGPATFMYLNRVAGMDEPRIRTAPAPALAASKE